MCVRIGFSYSLRSDVESVTCRYANMTLGQNCIVNNMTYTDTGSNGEQHMFTVTRDNCPVSPPSIHLRSGVFGVSTDQSPRDGVST